MSNKALELHVKSQTAVAAYIATVVERLQDDERGQVTTEWLMLMVAIVGIAGAIAVSGLLTTVSDAILNAFKGLLGKVTGKAV